MHGPPSAAGLLKVALFTAFLLVVSALLVMVLWNWLMPSIFELRQISLLEALGLLVLSRILLGGVRGRRMYGGWGGRWKEMSEADRQEWRKKRGNAEGGEDV